MIEELKKAKDRSPFQPFLILLKDGREIPVGHPDALGWNSTEPQTAVCHPPGGGWEMFEIAEIASLRTPVRERRTSPLIDRIRSAKRARPYRPFRIMLDDGSLHMIEQAENIAISPGERRRTISFYTRNDRKPGGYDHHYVPEDQILDVLTPEESRPSANGSAESEGA
jgi:hypothetical protein